jgi:hypothetical protein
MTNRIFASPAAAAFDRQQAAELALVVVAVALVFLSVPWTLGASASAGTA